MQVLLYKIVEYIPYDKTFASMCYRWYIWGYLKNSKGSRCVLSQATDDRNSDFM